MTNRHLRFAIAGGGIGGLATAIALARKGIASTVHERRASFPDEGAGIQIGPNGTRVLQELDVAGMLHDKVGTPAGLSVRDGATGRELTRFPLGDWVGARHDAPYWTAHRADLHAALRQVAESNPLVQFKLDAPLSAFNEDANAITFTTSDGEQNSYDGMVAADGLWSINRRHIAGDVTAAPAGKSAYRSVIAASAYPADLAGNDVHIWLMPYAHAVHYPVRSGREFGVVVIADDRDAVTKWNEPVDASVVADKVSSFAEPLRSLVGRGGVWRKWFLYDLPPLPRWTRGRAALLGDAAHPIPPFLAQGAVMALEDALTLAHHVSELPDDIPSALRNYEQARMTRVSRVGDASRRNGQIYHFSGLAAMARNTTLKLSAPEMLMSQYDWLYGWHL